MGVREVSEDSSLGWHGGAEISGFALFESLPSHCRQAMCNVFTFPNVTDGHSLYTSVPSAVGSSKTQKDGGLGLRGHQGKPEICCLPLRS